MNINYDNRLLERYKSNPTDAEAAIKKYILLGVKNIITRHEPEVITMKLAELYLQEMQLITSAMASITPKEFMQLFPITKDFDGHKYQFKDYFYTRDYVNKLPQDKPIGENIHHFLWEYMNHDITEFLVKLMETVSNLRKLEGLPSLAEQWAADNGIKTYTIYTDHKGNQFLFDNEAG